MPETVPGVTLSLIVRNSWPGVARVEVSYTDTSDVPQSQTFLAPGDAMVGDTVQSLRLDNFNEEAPTFNVVVRYGDAATDSQVFNQTFEYEGVASRTITLGYLSNAWMVASFLLSFLVLVLVVVLIWSCFSSASAKPTPQPGYGPYDPGAAWQSKAHTDL